LKRKQLLPAYIVLIVFVLSSVPSLKTSAQSDDGIPDSIVTLALMAVASDRLDGVLDNSDLANIYGLVDEYYEIKTNMKSDFKGESQRTALAKEKKLILTALDQKINLLKTVPMYAMTAHFVTTFEDTYENDENGLSKSILEVLSSSKYKPDQELIDLLNKKLAEDEGSNVEKSLDGHTATTIEGGEQLVEGNYDFSAGLSDEAFNEQLSQTKPLVFINNGSRDVVVIVEYYAPPKGAALSAPAGLNLTVPKNNSVTASGFPQGNYTFCYHWQTDLDMDDDGIIDYDKMVTHTWLSSANSNDPGAAAQIEVNSGGGFSASPLGRCDGFKGEALATQDIMTQEIFTEDNPKQWEAAVATAEDVAALPEEENPPQDGETGDENTEPPSDADFWDQGDGSSDEEDEEPPGGTDPDEGDTNPDEGGTDPGEGDPSAGLTTAEQVNQGQHSYSITGSSDGVALIDPEIESYTFTFTADGVNATLVQGGSGFLSKTAPNVYSDGSTTITFTESGWVAVGSTVWTMDGSVHPYNFTGTLIQ